MTKKIKKIIAVLLLVVMNSALLVNCVQAASFTSKRVFEIDYCDKVLTYNGSPVGAVYVVYEHEGKQYPAYCIEPRKIGIGDVDPYDVTIKGDIQDVGLWRVVINGYPYKTLEELGVANQKEAYLATKQAIYCYLQGRGTENYSYIGEAGRRTYNALNKILENASKSTETKIPNTVDIEPITGMWALDKINKEYVSKTYQIKNAAKITDYTVTLEGGSKPQGMVVADKNSNIKNTFKAGETFKVLIPSSSLNRDGEFTIKIKTQMDTKPVLYGESPHADYQDYAVTVYGYEDTTGKYYETYQKNTAQIKILKQEKETQKPLKGVEFQLLDKNKNAIYQSLKTDSNGKIILQNVNPGTYYVREIETLEGYVLYDEDIKVDISLNEVVNITVNNSKEKQIEVSKEETKIEVGQDSIKENINDKKEEITHDKLDKEKEENITEIEKNKQETTEKIEQNIDKTTENEKTNTVEKEINETINKLDKEINTTIENVNKELNEKIEKLDKEINTTIENINKELNQTTEKVTQTITNVTQNTHVQKLPVTGM